MAPNADLRAANKRTALVLASIALVFFAGIVFAKWMGDGDSGVTVLGVAVLLFLAFAVVRSIRK